MKKFVLIFFSFVVLTVSQLQAPCPSHAIWESILKANVDKEGYVDYDSIRIGKGGDLYEYLSFLETSDIKGCTDSEKIAFWINAYNATMVKLVLARPRMKEVSEDFNLFDEKSKIARWDLTLNQIEHRVLRSDPKKGGPVEGLSLSELDPRIHFALVCGAIDCPKLLNRAYSGHNLDAVLQANAAAFANNPKHLRLEEGKLTVSTLMKWYAEDFEKAGGAAAYLAALTDPMLRSDAAAVDEKLKTDYPSDVSFKYDWTLNSVRNKKPAAANGASPKP